MRFVSTRGGAIGVSLSQAIAAGLAPDGGLYVPERVPQVADSAPAGSMDGGLGAVALRALAPWFEGDALEHALPDIVREAFTFPVPVEPLNDERAVMLELFHGPTAAFKDFGARFLAACLQRLRAASEPPLTMLVATSGDTGSAVAAAFHRVAGVRVLVLYPDGRVSPRQAHQLGCFGDNVQALRVAGTFDDCQRLVKQAFADAALRERVALASANSINLGRLLPQMAYFAHAALEHAREHGEALGFIVPTGNLGNAFAGLLARAMGFPIGHIVLATNANRTLPDWFASGVLTPRPSVATLANAMDVGDPSNAERLHWLLPDPVARIEATSAVSVDDAAIRARIVASARDGAVVCPHTACALESLARRRANGDTQRWCVVATAHPAKFESVVEPLIGRAIPLPPALAAMLTRPAHAEPLAAEYAALRARLLLSAAGT